MKKYIFILFFLVVSLNISAQSLVSILKSAESTFNEGNYYGAAKLYQDALKLNNSMYDIHYKAGEAFMLDNDNKSAIKHFKKVANNKSDEYPNSIFYLAEMFKSNEDYQTAMFYYNKYLDNSFADQTSFTYQKAKRELNACEFAQSTLNKPKNVQITQLDTTINSLFSDFSANFNSDSLFLFSSVKPINNTNFTSKIYYLQNDTINRKSLLFDSIINHSNLSSANPFYVPELQAIFFTGKNTETNSSKDIYRSVFIDGKWKGPFKLPSVINNDNFNCTQASIVKYYEKWLMFYASDNPDGLGGYDIWYSEMTDKFRFSSPKIAGTGKDIDSVYIAFFGLNSEINTAGNEITPFYNTSDSCLYFSSDYLPGFGKFDIFKSKTDLDSWTVPENLGYPINSGQNDLYFTINKNKTKVFFTSNRKNSYAIRNQSCCNDIYSYRIKNKEKEKQDSIGIIKEQIETFTEKLKLLVPLTLYFDNDRPNPRTRDTVTNLNYTQTFNRYTQKIYKYKSEFSRGLEKDEIDFAKDSIDNFFNNYVISEYIKLNKFANLLETLVEQDIKITITLKGYSSPLNSTDYNENLAKRRVNCVMNYFREYKDALFIPYEKSGKITYEEVAFGETTSNKLVSDDINDKRNSVYSPLAAKERRIQIIAVSVKTNFSE